RDYTQLRAQPHLLSLLRQPPLTPLFPYTTLFRSLIFGDSLASFDASKPHLEASARSSEGPLTLDDSSMASAPPRSLRLPARSHRSEEHTSELQSRSDLVCRLLLEKKKNKQ